MSTTGSNDDATVEIESGLLNIGFDSEDEEQAQQEQDAKKEGRKQRIAAARLEAASYTAKIEDELWFNSPTAITESNSAGSKDAFRIAMYSMSHSYLMKEYHEILERGCRMLQEKNDSTDSGGDQIELLDLVLRAGLKLGVKESGKEEELVKWARRWKEHRSSPSLSHSSFQVLSQASPSLLVAQSPPEPITALLNSLKIHSSLPVYVSDLSLYFLSIQERDLAEWVLDVVKRRTVLREDLEREVEKLGWGEEEAVVLRKVLGLDLVGGQYHHEDDEDGDGEQGMRNVRNL